MSNREKIEKIKKEYEQKPEEKTDLELLRELDNKVKLLPIILGYVIGGVSTLIFGLGLTFMLEWKDTLWAIILSIIGILGIISAYFIYKAILNKRKEKYREQILTLATKLLNEEK